MKTAMAGTSLAAYRSLPPVALNAKEAEVMAVYTSIDMHMTREQLAARLGWKEASVCGRVNALVQKKQLEEIDGGITKAGRAAKLVRLYRGEPADLFGGLPS